MRRVGNWAGISEKERFLENVNAYVKELQGRGCKVRIGYDDGNFVFADALSRELRDGAAPDDTEIAIFDEMRVDMYGGGKTESISSLKVFPHSIRNFEYHLERAEQYFLRLWERGVEATDAISTWRESLRRWKSRLDYNSNWIARYEYHLDDRDRKLKLAELGETLLTLRQLETFGSIKSYLDIGTI